MERCESAMSGGMSVIKNLKMQKKAWKNWSWTDCSISELADSDLLLVRVSETDTNGVIEVPFHQTQQTTKSGMIYCTTKSGYFHGSQKSILIFQ